MSATMQILINAQIVIHQSPVHVFTWLTAMDKWALWGGNLVSMEQISDGPLQVGAQLRHVTKGGRESIVEVIDYVPNQSFGIKSPNLVGTFTLEPLEVGTRLKARFEVEAAGLMALLYRLMLKQFVMSDLRQLKKRIESNEVSVGKES